MDRRRMMTKQPRLPSEYQEVEWIGSSGTQYINTLLKHDDYKFDVQYKANNNTGCPISSVINTSNRCGLLVVHGSNRIDYFFGNSGYQVLNLLQIDLNNKIHIVMDNKSIKIIQDEIVEEVTYTYKVTITPGSNYVYINAYMFLHSYMSGFVYNCIILKNDIELRNFIPCYRKSDGVIGMYDLCGSICPLTNTPFYINEGTGTFTKGADVK